MCRQFRRCRSSPLLYGFCVVVVEGVEVALLMVMNYKIENRLTLRRGYSVRVRR